MSLRRRMNAAASRPAIVLGRAGEDRRPPAYIPTLTRDWISRDELNRPRPNSPQRRNRGTLAVAGDIGARRPANAHTTRRTALTTLAAAKV